MKHAREDYNERIIDVTGKIPDDEPVFLLRGQDQLFVDMLTYYSYRIKQGYGDFKLSTAIDEYMPEVKKWQDEHGAKRPDMPKDNTPQEIDINVYELKDLGFEVVGFVQPQTVKKYPGGSAVRGLLIYDSKTDIYAIWAPLASVTGSFEYAIYLFGKLYVKLAYTNI